MTDEPAGQPILRLSTTRPGGRRVVAAVGEVDIATAGEFAARLRAELACGPVVLDLSELVFVDSAGVRALNDLLEEIDRCGWTLRVRPVLSLGVRRVLELTGMLELLPIGDEPEPELEPEPGEKPG
jgi:anti-anti-sigma factor